MWIAGAGFACPEGRIENTLLEELRPDYKSVGYLSTIGITSRATSLPEEYLRETGNKVVRLAPKVAFESSVQLGVRAARMALERAGLTIEEIGLVIADGITPVETTPAQAAQIGQAFGLKIPVFDLVMGGGGLPHILSTLCTWKRERLSHNILVVSTNTLTQRVNYRTGNAGAFLGDGACAFVLSAEQRSRGLQVAQCWSQAGKLSGFLLSGFESIRFDPEAFLAEQRARTIYIIERLAPEAQVAQRDLDLVLGNADPKLSMELARQFQFRPERVISTTGTLGYSGSSAAGVALAQHWDMITHRPEILIADSGSGTLFGGLLCRGTV